MKDTAILISTFLRDDALFNCVSSIRKFYPDVVIFVADTGHESKSKDDYCTKYRCKLFKLPFDAGVCVAKNEGIERIPDSYRYVFVCEDDIIFTEMTRLEILRDILEERKQVGIVGGSLKKVKGHEKVEQNYEATLRIEKDTIYIEKVEIVITTNSGGGCDDCTPPTLGINSHGERLVDGGFSYNGKMVDAALFHTEFPLINATIGEINVIKIKIYENGGVQNIQNIQFGLGVIEVGKPLSLSEVIILVGLHHNGTAVKLIDITDEENLIDHNSVNATVNTTKCKPESYKEDCLLVNLQYSYTEAPKYNVMLVTPMDDKRNTWNFYFNDGIRVIGESLNPPPTYNIHVKKTSQAFDNWLTLIRTDKINDVWTDKKGIQYQHNNNNFDRITPHESWTCKDKPLDQINVPTRNNCNFRALTNIWGQ